MQQKQRILGLILAGGAGRRVGGLDKGLVEYLGKPLVRHVFDKLTPQVHEIAIAVHRNEDDYKRISKWVVVDQTNKHEGPMAGIVALIEDLRLNRIDQRFNYLTIASCDVPNLPTHYVEELITAIQIAKADVAVVHDGERKQNLHCLIRTPALPSLLKFYQTDGRAMHRWFATQKVIEVDFSSSADAFRNLNSIEQMKFIDS